MQNQTTAPRAINIHNDSTGLRPMPPVVDKQVFTVPNFSSQPKFDNEIPDVTVDNARLKADLWQAHTGINRRFSVIGMKDSKIQTEELIGRVALPNVATYTVVRGAARHQRCLTLAPAIAALASELKDRSYLAAITAAQTLFSTRGSNDKFSSATQSAVRTLLMQPPDPTRFIFKLAQLWVYHAYCESAGVHPALVGTITRPVELADVSTIASSLVAARQGQHFAFIPGEQFAGNFENILSVLTAAASNLKVPPSQRDSLPTILGLEVDMPPITVAHTGYCDAPMGISNDLTSADVWEAMSMWASVHECLPLMNEMVDFVLGQLYSTKEGCDEIFSVETLTLALPPLDMSHYALFPLHMAVNNLPQLSVAEPPSLLLRAAPLVLRNQLLSTCFSAALARLHIGATQPSYRYLHQANRWLAAVFQPTNGHVGNVWSVLQCAAADLGIKVGFSRTTASLMPGGWKSSNLNACWRDPMLRATQCEELVDVLPAVPTCSLAHMMAPVKSDLLCQPGHMYSIDNIAGGWLARAAYALKQVGGTIFNLSRPAGSFDVTVVPAEYHLSYRHVLHDNAIPYKFNDEDIEQKTVFSVPDAAASLQLYQGDRARAGWSWFINGVNADSLKTSEVFTLAEPLHSERSGLKFEVAQQQHEANAASAPPSGRRAMRPPTPVELPEPTEVEKLKSIALRVPLHTSTLVESVTTAISPGVFKDLANTLIKCADPQKPVGITDQEWRRGFFSNIRNQVAGVSLVAALQPVPAKSRHRVAKGMAKIFKDLIKYTDYEDNRRALSELAVRADNVAYAMALNPAITGAELQESMDVPRDMLDTLDGIAQAALEYGLDLSTFIDKKNTRYKYRVVAEDSAEFRELRGNGWVVDHRDTGKLKVGTIKLSKREEIVIPGHGIETVFAPELLDKLNDTATHILAAIDDQQEAAAAEHPDVQLQSEVVEEGMVSAENDATIGREGSGSVAELRSAADPIKDSLPKQDFSESQELSGSGALLQSTQLPGTGQSDVSVSAGMQTASAAQAVSEPTSVTTKNVSWDNIPSATFTEVPDKQ